MIVVSGGQRPLHTEDGAGHATVGPMLEDAIGPETARKKKSTRPGRQNRH